MSIIQEYRNTEAQLKELQARFAELQSDNRLTKELEFEAMVRELLTEYDKTPSDLLAIFYPNGVKGETGKPSAGVKKPRAIKTYKNPNTGEVIETKGGNHKGLKLWKEQYGSETVESWLV